MTTQPSQKTTADASRLVEQFQLGIDGRGARHVADLKTNTVHIVHPDGSRGRKLLDAGDLDDYVDAVADARGWQRREYGVSWADMLIESVEVP